MGKDNADMENLKIGVVGAGSWGTALANLLGHKGFSVHLWAYEKEVKEQIDNFKENKYFLPGITLSPQIIPSNEFEEVVAGKDLLVFVVPSHFMRAIAQQMVDLVSKETIIISASKGIVVAATWKDGKVMGSIRRYDRRRLDWAIAKGTVEAYND